MTVRLREGVAISSPSTRGGTRAAFWATLICLAWGVLAFGGVYSWAYWPLAVLAQAAGFLGLFCERRNTIGVSRWLGVALAAVLGAGLLQMIPLPAVSLDEISPSTIAAVTQIDPSFASGLSTTHPLSLHPPSTWVALALYGSFALLLVGTSRLLSVKGSTKFVQALTTLGVVVALVGIIQKPLAKGLIYGFWTTESGGEFFGPFVNKNHFAGWMLMTIPLTLGVLFAGIARGMRGVQPGWRNAVIWFSSKEANSLVLLGGGAALMSLSLVMTMSRSGIGALAVAILITGWFAIRRGTGTTGRAAAVAYLIVLVAVVVSWAGVDAIAARFAQANWSDFDARKGAWLDAWSIANRFRITGTGLNTYSFATLLYQEHNLSQHFAQAHNDYLQLLTEGGLLVVFPVLVLVGVFVRDVRTRFREDAGSSSYWVRVGALTSLVAIALQELVDFSLQMPGNAALFAIVCGIALHKSPGRRVRVPDARMSVVRI
jgi:hypothetical protein